MLHHEKSRISDIKPLAPEGAGPQEPRLGGFWHTAIRPGCLTRGALRVILAHYRSQLPSLQHPPNTLTDPSKARDDMTTDTAAPSQSDKRASASLATIAQPLPRFSKKITRRLSWKRLCAH